MKTKYLSLPLILLTALITVNCRQNQNTFDQIIRFELQRAACDSLVPFLADPEPQVRTRAVEAIGKLQDRTCRAAVENMLDDLNHNVRRAAAFALGQMGDSLAQGALTTRLQTKDRTEVKARILEALGKVGTRQTFTTLIKFMNHRESSPRSQAALSVARMALRDHTDPAATKAVTALLKDPSASVRWNAAYALMRIDDDHDVPAFIQSLRDSEPRVRMYAAPAIGRTQSLVAMETLGRMLANDLNWRVRVSAANALGNYPLSLSANFFTPFEQNHHVRKATIQAIGSSAEKEPQGYRANNREHNLARHLLEPIMNRQDTVQAHPAEIGAALIAYARLLGPEAEEAILPFLSHSNHKLRTRAVEALAECGAPNVVNIFAQEYSEAPTQAKIAILQHAPDLPFEVDSRIYLQALESNDQVLVALAARGLAQDSLANVVHAARITHAYRDLTEPVDPEGANMIFQAMAVFKDTSAISVLEETLHASEPALAKAATDALKEITGQDYSSQLPDQFPVALDFDYSEIDALKGSTAFIKTERGDIEIDLFASNAPLTVLNFVRLAEDGFFDGLTFHRVVPNFVIQGGDPRGDSWGSPGYTIRSEFNERPYLRGTVGMASAGKDTEGCQFFITHSPQPHLDGRYTVFGQVTSGMDVVDAIREEDKIVRVGISR